MRVKSFRIAFTKDELARMKFALQRELEILNNGDFEDDDSRDEERAGTSALRKIEAALDRHGNRQC